MQKLALLCALLFCAFLLSMEADAREIVGKDDQGRDYWVYVPDTLDPEKTYTLVVGVHGYKRDGKGAGGFAGWVKDHDVIVLGPSFNNDGYQYLLQGSDEQTIDLVKKLRKDYKLHDKIFIAGFSGGAQYAHRFAMKYPSLVAGCAAHSGGTWATGDYAERMTPNPKARGVLFVISCGEKDTGKSFGDAPMGRLEWAKKFERMLDEGGFIYHARWWPGVGHSQSKGSRQQTLDCFVASTRRLPEYDAERDAISKAIRSRDYRAAWAIVNARLTHEDSDDEGILGNVHTLFVASLESDISRIDRQAEREVSLIVRKHRDADALRAALEKHKADYANAPRTMDAVDKALAEIN